MSNEVFQAVTVLVIALEVAALLLSLGMRKGLWPVAWLNLVLALVVLAAAAPRLASAFAGDDVAVLALLVFEIVVVATSLAWLAKWRVPAWLPWLEFAAHALASIAVLTFAFTFRLSRLM